MQTNLITDRLVLQIMMSNQGDGLPARSPNWTTDEKRFLSEHLDWPDWKIGEALGRTENAVKVKRFRLYLPPVSKVPGWLSANRARIMLGMNDTRPIIGWIKSGLIGGHRASCNEPRVMWLVLENSLKRFVANPRNWPRFDRGKVADPGLRALIYAAERKYRDEWISTRQAADLVGLAPGDINRCIKLGRLEGFQIVNRDGRRSVHDKPSWAFWYVRKSDVLKLNIRRNRGSSCQPVLEGEALEFLQLACRVGLSDSHIEKLMGRARGTIQQCRRACFDRGQPPMEDWRNHRARFPSLDRAARNLAAGRVRGEGFMMLLDVLAAQLAGAGLRKHRTASGRAGPATIRAMRDKLIAHGIEPYL